MSAPKGVVRDALLEDDHVFELVKKETGTDPVQVSEEAKAIINEPLVIRPLKDPWLPPKKVGR